MLLSHYSPSDSITLENLRFSRPSSIKPAGFWLSDDSRGFGWRDWCEMENFRIEKLEYLYEVNIGSDNLAFVDTAGKLLAFHKAYSYFAPKYELAMMDWKKVARDYKGIICSPFLGDLLMELDFSLRLHLSWYFAMDCDSACVWDKSAILSISAAKMKQG